MWEKHYTPPPQTTPTFEIQNQNKGIEDIMDIDANCPSLLFGETTSHLTSKWRGTFQYIFLMLKIAWNAKKTWNIENKIYIFNFFQYLKNS